MGSVQSTGLALCGGPVVKTKQSPKPRLVGVGEERINSDERQVERFDRWEDGAEPVAAQAVLASG